MSMHSDTLPVTVEDLNGMTLVLTSRDWPASFIYAADYNPYNLTVGCF